MRRAALAATGATAASRRAAQPIVARATATRRRFTVAVAASAGAAQTPAAASASDQMTTAPAERRRGAVLGALAADAATMPLHWIYKAEVMDSLLKSKPGAAAAPEFFDPPSCPFYQMPLGALSPYGAEAAALLRHLAARPPKGGAALDGGAWARDLADYFANTYPGYKNKSIKSLIANLEAGKQYPQTGDDADTQANMLCKLPVVAAAYAGAPAFAGAVEAAVRAQQASQAAVDYGLAAGRILERVVLGSSVGDAVAWAAAGGDGQVPDAARALVRAAAETAADASEPFNAAAQRLGASCAMPGALQVALVAALRAKGDYEAGVRMNMLAGGDNASRAVYLGALLGAQAGGPPKEWQAKVAGIAEFEAAAERVAAW